MKRVFTLKQRAQVLDRIQECYFEVRLPESTKIITENLAQSGLISLVELQDRYGAEIYLWTVQNQRAARRGVNSADVADKPLRHIEDELVLLPVRPTIPVTVKLGTSKTIEVIYKLTLDLH